MKTVVLGIVMTLLLHAGAVAAECLYQGVPYSEGARVCMHRTMYMCRGEKWVKTAERCWERYLTAVSRNRGPANNFFPRCGRVASSSSVTADLISSVEEEYQ